MNKAKSFRWLALLMVCTTGYAQVGFQYKRKIVSPQAENWYSIPLPADVFLPANRDFSDFRIYQITTSDTSEVPYLLRTLNDVVVENLADADIFNKSLRDGVFYATLEIKKKQKVNQLFLEFEEENFNGKVQLEGSEDMKGWFKIDEPQRILSINRNDINFKATTLSFTESSYRYLRLAITSDVPLTLTGGSLKDRAVKSGVHVSVPSSLTITNEKSAKQTIVTVTLKQFQPVGMVNIETASNMDYYRPFTIETLRDSAKVPKGWTYYYDNVYSGYITSLEGNRYEFTQSLTNKIRITIQNADNQPLEIKSVTLTSPQIEIVARVKPGENFLFYGNPKLVAPSYDVVHFTNKIPDSLSSLSVEPPENLTKPTEKISPLLENKMWLWGIMAIVIALLGYATVRMMKAKV